MVGSVCVCVLYSFFSCLNCASVCLHMCFRMDACGHANTYACIHMASTIEIHVVILCVSSFTYLCDCLSICSLFYTHGVFKL